MSLLRSQKQLQKQFYQKQQKQAKPQPADEMAEENDAQSTTVKPVATKGPIAAKSKVVLVNQLVEADMASYKGLSIEDKRTIKSFLVHKYKSELEWILISKPKETSLLLNAYVIWLYDLGEIEQFLTLVDQASQMGQRQTILPQKTYDLVKLYWILDWAYAEKEHGRSFEPYFSQVFDSITDWNQPKRIREGYWYLRFYTLLNQGKLTEALELGPKAMEYGAAIKTNLGILEGILAGTIPKQWDVSTQSFVDTKQEPEE